MDYSSILGFLQNLLTNKQTQNQQNYQQGLDIENTALGNQNTQATTQAGNQLQEFNTSATNQAQQAAAALAAQVQAQQAAEELAQKQQLQSQQQQTFNQGLQTQQQAWQSPMVQNSTAQFLATLQKALGGGSAPSGAAGKQPVTNLPSQLPQSWWQPAGSTSWIAGSPPS